jgi:hypothetical protein
LRQRQYFSSNTVDANTPEAVLIGQLAISLSTIPISGMAATNKYSPLHMQDFEQMQSPDGDSSAAESGSEHLADHNDSQASRGSKRKRPLMVS